MLPQEKPKRRSGTAQKITRKLNCILGVVMFELLIHGLEYVIEILDWLSRGVGPVSGQ